MGADRDLALLVALFCDPALDQLRGEDAAFDQEARVALERRERLAERARQGLDGPTPLLGPREDVLVDRPETEFGGIEPTAYPVETCEELNGDTEIRVAGGVRGSEFDASGVRLVGIARDADGGRTVAG